jgi:twinkle protein
MKLAGMAINRNPSNEEISNEDLKVGFDKVFKDDRVIVLDHQGSINDASIVEQLEYMALMGCEYLFIDHITILTSEGADGKEGNAAIDLVMNHLLRLVKRHPIWIGLVSHLRKVASGKKSFEQGKLPTMDDIRGSGSIKQVSFDILAFARDMTSPDEIIRNSIIMSVLKSRTIGLTGPISGAFYDQATGRLTHSEYLGDEVFEDL